MKKFRENDFEYILKLPRVVGRVVFGSSRARSVGDAKDMSPFMRLHIQGNLDNPGPGAYTPAYIEKSTLYNKRPIKFSTKRRKSQLSVYPEVGDYNIDVRKPITRNVIGACAESKNKLKYLTPGVGTYNIANRIEKLKPHSAFGSAHQIIPVFRIMCTPVNKAKCFKCSQTPEGDYFRDFTKKLDLCYPCMENWRNVVKDCKINNSIRLKRYKEIQSFKPARYCDFYHTHSSGTKAAVPKMTKAQLKKRQQIENYLFPYMKY